jgi:methionyl-tRNA formyltransferase
MVRLFQDTYPTLRNLEFARHPQPPRDGSFHRASELEAASRLGLDDTYTARALLNLLRARTFPPHPACWFTDGGRTYEVRVAITPRKR